MGGRGAQLAAASAALASAGNGGGVNIMNIKPGTPKTLSKSIV